MNKPAKQKYKTTNWKTYSQALKARGSLMVWLDREMAWQAPSSGKPGQPAIYSDAAVQCCLTMKVLLGLSLRQTQGFVQSVLALSGLGWKAPDYSTVSRRQKRMEVQITARLLGERVMARTFERQVVELQVRAAVLNRLTHLGTPVTRAVA
jgi:hypothetical protein